MSRKFRPTGPARDIYQETTDKIIAAIEAGTPPWRCDWSGPAGGSPLRWNGEEYRGVNVLLLGMAGFAGGYSSRHWLTFKQAQELGGNVRKGEKSAPVVFFRTIAKDAEGDKRADDNGQIHVPCLRQYAVFNAEQIEGLDPARFAGEPVELFPGKARDKAAESALLACGATVHHEGSRAFYRRSTDAITLPEFDRFRTTAGYLGTLAHELVHWTGAPHRLARTKGESFGDAAYAFEELVAEIGASFLGAKLGFFGEHMDNHAAYIAGWLEALRNDKRAIFRAAALAQAAADLILAGMPDAAPVAPVAAPAAVITPAQFSLAF